MAVTRQRVLGSLQGCMHSATLVSQTHVYGYDILSRGRQTCQKGFVIRSSGLLGQHGSCNTAQRPAEPSENHFTKPFEQVVGPACTTTSKVPSPRKFD